jgi:HlyD family secretion protein
MSKFFSNTWEFLKKNRKITIPVGVILLIVVIVAAMNARGKTKSTYQTEAVAKGDLTATIGATGSVRAAQSATLLWQTTGVVDKVNVQVGDSVSKDQVLATLVRSSLPQNVILAEADLVSAQTALDNLVNSSTARAQAAIALKTAQDAYDKAYNYRISLNDKIDLSKITYITLGGHLIPQIKYYKGYADADSILKADNDLALKKGQLDDAQRAYDRLKDGPNADDVAAAQARVDAAQAALNAGQISAPFAGIVTQANPMPGDLVSPTSPGFRIDDLAHLLVDVQVSEIDINSVAVGQPVTLSFDAISGKTYQGQVLEVSQAGDVVSGSVNFTVTVELTDADKSVKPGMTAAVTVLVNQVKGQLLIPNRAVRLVDGNRVVYILVNGQPKQVTVILGASSDTMSVVNGGDLKEGDLVILNPPTLFTPGAGGGPFRAGGGGG